MGTCLSAQHDENELVVDKMQNSRLMHNCIHFLSAHIVASKCKNSCVKYHLALALLIFVNQLWLCPVAHILYSTHFKFTNSVPFHMFYSLSERFKTEWIKVGIKILILNKFVYRVCNTRCEHGQIILLVDHDDLNNMQAP